MLPDRANNNIAHGTPTTVHHNWIYRRVALPIFALLRMGASPEKLAWSIAFGLLTRWPAGRIAVRAAGGAIAIAGAVFLSRLT